ncbi:MAG: PEP-CTERM sorting domain-containing protein [Bythopirellula sp.]
MPEPSTLTLILLTSAVAITCLRRS